MPPKGVIFGAMFDVRPIKASGVLDFEKVKTVKLELDLRKKTAAVARVVSSIQPPPPPVDPKLIVLQEFERVIAEPVNVEAELTSVGGKVHQVVVRPRPRPRWIRPKTRAETEAIESFWSQAEVKTTGAPCTGRPCVTVLPVQNLAGLAHPEARLARAPEYRYGSGAREVEFWVERLKQKEYIPPPTAQFRRKRVTLPRFAKRWPFGLLKKSKMMVIGLTVAVAMSWTLGQRGLDIKNNVIGSGERALANLEEAKSSLVDSDFLKAADNFALAYEDFGRASNALSELGASFLSSFGNIPGLDKVKSANNLVKAGQHISKAGENLALAFDALSKTNFFAFLDAGSRPRVGGQSLATLVRDFRDVLVSADGNVSRARNLLADIDSQLLPPGKQGLFVDFREKIPDFQKYIGSAIDYTDFLLGVVGEGGTKKYIVLLQNNSELRATGGFPGTYAVLTFKEGRLAEVLVDDIYNIDGQMRENIIPPKPLQHITPNWGMRDANWFADFPTSARKVQELYAKDGGGAVDGVLSITPDVIRKILAIIGPLEMPEYGLTLTADNLLAEIQEEVEYGENRSQPKTIVKDLQPRLFARLAEVGKDRWLEIFKALTEASEKKHILMYFNDPELENMARAHGLAGEIKQTPGDYLQVVLSNVKGSKTDAYIDSSYALKTQMVDQGILHELTISRLHRGGDTPFGFYNRVSPAYVRVYVPQGAVLESIQGHSQTDYRPLITHGDYNFKRDPDLIEIEGKSRQPFSGVDMSEESGKTVIGFWLVLKPKEAKSAVLTYRTPMVNPNDYNLIWQKQSGTKSDGINFSFSIPEAKRVLNQSDGLRLVGQSLRLSFDLSTDREIKINLR